MTDVYMASPISADNDNRRHRATKEEMEDRARFLVAYAARHAPVTVRQLYYAATVANVPGIKKDDNGYNAVQAQVLALRRAGRMPYGNIADLTRYRRGSRLYGGVDDAIATTARLHAN